MHRKSTAASLRANPLADAKAEAVNGRDVLRGIRLKLSLDRLSADFALRACKRSSTRDLQAVLAAVMDCCDAPMGNIQMIDGENALRLCVWSGFDEEFVTFFATVTDATACHQAFALGRPVVVENVAVSPLYTSESRRVMLNARAQSVQSVALRTGTRKIGVISVHYPQPGIPEQRQKILADLAPLLAELVEKCGPPPN